MRFGRIEWRKAICGHCSLVLLGIGFLTPLISGCKAKAHQVDLTWNAPASSPVPIVGYNIYRSADEGASYRLLNSSPVHETRYVDTLIQSGRSYQYMVKSMDAKGIESSASNMVSVKIP